MGKQRYWSGNGRTSPSPSPSPSPSSTTRRSLKIINQQQPNYTSVVDLDHEASNSTSAGCMCAVFQLFDFHPLNNQHHQSSVSLNPIISPPLPDDHISKGTEAPRNSLESDEESPLSCTPKPKQEEDRLHFPKGIVQIKTKISGMKGSSPNNNINEAKENYLCGNSPSTAKTPTLVARLMGLDLLPESNSPSTTPTTRRSTASASPKPKTSGNNNNNNNNNNNTSRSNHLMGSRSLPETPRTSCEKKSNLDQINYHHRLSLQIPNSDKENASPSPSPSHYAKEIVKQIKESVSRKGGLNDITNYTRRDQEVIHLQTNKPKKVLSSSSMNSSSVISPRLKNNLNKPSPKVEEIKPKQKVKPKMGLKKKGNNNKQEEPFVVPSSRIMTKAAIIDSPGPIKTTKKKTPLSNELLSFSSVPTIVMKKDPPFSSPIQPTDPLQSPCNRNQGADETDDKESNRFLQSSNSQQRPHIPTIHHHQHVIQLQPNTNNINNKDSNNPKHHITTTAAPAAPAADCSYNHNITAELEYVRQILLRRTTSTTSSSLYSVFTHNNVSISHRKLLCHLVEELLKPYVEITPYRQPTAERWPEVVEKLCEKVRKLPRAKCEVLEDIDGIIEKDMDILGMGFEAEGEEGIVKEIEEWIVEELLNETVRFVEEVRDVVV